MHYVFLFSNSIVKDAAQLANHSASTISSLAQLHPDAPHPSDTPAPRTDILPPPLKPPATPLCDPLIISTMLKKLPLSSAADHGGWRYDHLKWAFSLDSVGEADLLTFRTPLMLLHLLSQVAEPVP